MLHLLVFPACRWESRKKGSNRMRVDINVPLLLALVAIGIFVALLLRRRRGR
jgi:hypothetical protein